MSLFESKGKIVQAADDEDDEVEAYIGRPVRELNWDDSNIWAVITRISGSVWPRVFPYCVVNALLTLSVLCLKQYAHIDLTSNASGHRYMGTMMSFLLVNRVRITYNNYMTHATNLNKLYTSCRELMQTLSMLTAVDKSDGAKRWRQDVAFSVILLLRVSVAVLDWRSNPTDDPWINIPELQVNLDNQEDVKLHSFLADNSSSPLNESSDEEKTAERSLVKGLGHVEGKERTVLEEAFRAPIVLAYNVRREILKQRDGTWMVEPRKRVWLHDAFEEIRLMQFIDDFLKAFSGLKVLITTPFPFPLVQMTKTFLYVWIFTLPLSLCHGTNNFIVPVFLIFLITFGFMGLECVVIALSDPFGDDPSDFDDLGLAYLCFEDIYINIYKLDGIEWAQALRDRVLPRLKKTTREEMKAKERAEQDWGLVDGSTGDFGTDGYTSSEGYLTDGNASFTDDDIRSATMDSFLAMNMESNEVLTPIAGESTSTKKTRKGIFRSVIKTPQKSGTIQQSDDRGGSDTHKNANRKYRREKILNLFR